jgi:hypothetical protein
MLTKKSSLMLMMLMTKSRATRMSMLTVRMSRKMNRVLTMKKTRMIFLVPHPGRMTAILKIRKTVKKVLTGLFIVRQMKQESTFQNGFSAISAVAQIM